MTARAKMHVLALAVALSSSGLGCALEPREGDGLVSDGREIQITPSVVVDAGRAAPGMSEKAKPCKNVALYRQHVEPVFITHCLECHDGEKPKATIALYLVDIKVDPELTCSAILTYGATKPEKLQAEILTSSDPSRTDVVHDFKFETMAEFNSFRDAVMKWLSTE